MIKAIVYHNGEQIKTYEFEKSLITVGRLPQSDIPINSTSISRIHLKITYNWGKQAYFVTDLNSLNGTSINGVKIAGDTQLNSGEKLVTGKFAIVFEFIGAPKIKEVNDRIIDDFSPEKSADADVAEETSAPSAIANSGDGIFFSNVIKKGDNEEIPAHAFLIELNNKIIYKINKRVMSFGNAANDDFYIESGVFASENMATLTVSEDGYLLHSNTMMGRFKVNGNKVSKRLLQNKDRIELGGNVFTFKMKNDR